MPRPFGGEGYRVETGAPACVEDPEFLVLQELVQGVEHYGVLNLFSVAGLESLLIFL
jgi:hypothetical protein